jgi:hypothetical protein
VGNSLASKLLAYVGLPCHGQMFLRALRSMRPTISKCHATLPRYESAPSLLIAHQFLCDLIGHSHLVVDILVRPMIPKSNARLSIGDYCLVQRHDGRYVPFVYVGKRGAERMYFFGALANVILSSGLLDCIPERLVLGAHALIHIKSYRENNTPILGNIRDRLDELSLARIARDLEGSGIGHTASVWGWRTIIKYADQIGA